MSILVYSGTTLIQRWDDVARTYTDLLANTSRPYTPEENARADVEAAAALAGSNGDQIITKARAAQTSNATYLAIASPTTAQAVAQVGKLTKQVNALIKLELNDLATTDGT